MEENNCGDRDALVVNELKEIGFFSPQEDEDSHQASDITDDIIPLHIPDTPSDTPNEHYGMLSVPKLYCCIIRYHVAKEGGFLN